MAVDTPPRPQPSTTVRPFLVVAAAVISQTCAGTMYWWPAITPGLSHHLGFSAAQSAALVATANSGSTLGFLGGFFHARFGSRTTAAVGAATLSLCFASLSRLAASKPPQTPTAVTVAFAATLLLSVLVVTFSYMVYSSALTVSVAVFPPMFRGRVVGLNSAAYGGAAAVLACVQAAFFPSLADTAPMLLLVSLLCMFVTALVLVTFPGDDHYAASYEIDAASVSARAEQAPLLGDEATQSDFATRHISNRLTALYAHAWAFVIALQAGALADNFEAPRPVVVAMAIAIVCALLAVLAVPARTGVKAHSVIGSADAGRNDQDSRNDEPGFGEVIRDRRYQLLCAGALVLVAGGGISLLVQAPIIVAAWGHASGALEDKEALGTRVSTGVRALVSLFAACNITARLAGGAVMDWGVDAKERELWKFRMFHLNALKMGCGLALLGAAVRPLGLLGVAMVGASYGTYFAVGPALTAVWFGVRSFPLNFAVIGPFVAVGAATLSSVVPGWLRAMFGSWRTVGGGDGQAGATTCVGVACVLPAMGTLAALQVGLYAMGQAVWPLVRATAGARR